MTDDTLTRVGIAILTGAAIWAILELTARFHRWRLLRLSERAEKRLWAEYHAAHPPAWRQDQARRHAHGDLAVAQRERREARKER